MSERWYLVMAYDTVVKLVDSMIASRALGELPPLSSEGYEMLEAEVSHAEKRSLTSGKTIYEEMYHHLTGKTPTEEELESVRVQSTSN